MYRKLKYGSVDASLLQHGNTVMNTCNQQQFVENGAVQCTMLRVAAAAAVNTIAALIRPSSENGVITASRAGVGGFPPPLSHIYLQ